MRRRGEAVVLASASGQPFGRRRRARPAEGTRSREAHVVQEDDEYIGRTRRWPQRLDRWRLRLRVLRVERNRAVIRPIRDRKDITLGLGLAQRSPPICSTIEGPNRTRFAGDPPSQG